MLQLPAHQRIAIGRRARDPAEPDGAARAAHVLDDHGLAERFTGPCPRGTSVAPPGANGTTMVIGCEGWGSGRPRGSRHKGPAP